jgi:hypothetical protein
MIKEEKRERERKGEQWRHKTVLDTMNSTVVSAGYGGEKALHSFTVIDCVLENSKLGGHLLHGYKSSRLLNHL